MHKLLKIQKMVDSKFEGLGQPVIFSITTLIAKRALFLVASKGCGKTTAADIANQIVNKKIFSMNEITRTGMISHAEQIHDTDATFYIKDVGSINDVYNRVESVSLGVDLCYSHSFSKSNKMGDVEISNYQGAFITTIQPFAYAKFVKNDVYENALIDRIIRYYHIVRPRKPVEKFYEFPTLKTKYELHQVNDAIVEKSMRPILDVFEMQFTVSRAREHCIAMLKAIAIIDNRKKIMKSDYQLLLKMCAPMMVESHVFVRKEPERPVHIDFMTLVFLTEFTTYKEIDFTQFRINYKISMTNIKATMAKYSHLWIPHPKKKNVVLPSYVIREVLEEIEGLV